MHLNVAMSFTHAKASLRDDQHVHQGRADMRNTGTDLDRELARILAEADRQRSVATIQPTVIPAPSPVMVRPTWPWQVPQVPSYTADGAPQGRG